MKKSQPNEPEQYYSILQWIVEKNIVNERGEIFNFKDRAFLLDILTDFSPNIVCVACAQVGNADIPHQDSLCFEASVVAGHLHDAL